VEVSGRYVAMLINPFQSLDQFSVRARLSSLSEDDA
jgi:hypothetical protein